jgi:DNA-binding NtrC family response regulator
VNRYHQPVAEIDEAGDENAPHRVLVADDDPAIRKVICDRLKAAGHDVAVAANGVEALRQIEAFCPAMVLLDLRMPELDGFGVLEALNERESRPEVVVITAHGSIDAAVRAVKLGATDFLSKPFEPVHVELVVARTLASARRERRIASLEHELSGRHTLVAGESLTMQHVIDVAARAAPSAATVLLLGESGSGKEVIARYIHDQSGRADDPFVALNCATLSEELLASELFGHEKGAFTGAVKTKIGRIEQAAGGTLFLDEIGELPPPLQAKLLRVLQEREFDRVGGTRPIRADARFVAATHQDLTKAIADKRFREDLYYRLNVISVKVPPLRERRADLPALIAHFLVRHARAAGRRELRLSPEAQDLLERYDWPGNVRELGNVLERAAVLATSDEVHPEDLPEEIRALTPIRESAVPLPAGAEEPRTYQEAVNDAKRDIILTALARHDDHQTNAARELGVTQPYLARLMKNLGLKLKR